MHHGTLGCGAGEANKPQEPVGYVVKEMKSGKWVTKFLGRRDTIANGSSEVLLQLLLLKHCIKYFDLVLQPHRNNNSCIKYL